MLERDDETGDPSDEAKLAEARAILEAVGAALDGEAVDDFMGSFPIVAKAQEVRLNGTVQHAQLLMELDAALSGKMVQDQFVNHPLVKKASEVSNRAEKWADFPVRVLEVQTQYGPFQQATAYLKFGTETLEGWGLSRNKDRAVAYALEDLSDRIHDYVRRSTK
jgi:hypothetical protein